MGHEGAHLLGVACDQGQPVDGTATAGENVDRAGADRIDQPVQVVSVLLGGRPLRVIRADAALDAAGVVGNHGPVGEMRREAGEPEQRPSGNRSAWSTVSPDRRSPRTSYTRATPGASSVRVSMVAHGRSLRQGAPDRTDRHHAGELIAAQTTTGPGFSSGPGECRREDGRDDGRGD